MLSIEAPGTSSLIFGQFDQGVSSQVVFATVIHIYDLGLARQSPLCMNAIVRIVY